MAYSPTFNTTNQYIKYRIEVIVNSQSIENNTSNVTVKVQVWRTNTGYSTYGSGTCYTYVDGSWYSQAITPSQHFEYYSYTEVYNRTFTISHNADGSKNLQTDAYIVHDMFSSTDQGWSYALPTIPRASQPTLSATTFTMGTQITIYTNRVSSSFTHTIRYYYGNQQANIATGVTTSTTWTMPVSFASETPNATSGVGTIYCDTYNGATFIGTKTIGFTANIPASVIPTLNNFTLAETSTEVINANIGAYVQNKSNIRITPLSPQGIYGSTITAMTAYIDGNPNSIPLSPAYLDTGILSNTSYTIAVDITDSRGRKSTQYSQNVSLLAYSDPNITTFTTLRCNSGGTPDPLGTYISLGIAGVVSSLVVSTVQKNTLGIAVYARVKGTSPWGTAVFTATGTPPNYSYSSGASPISGYSVLNAYEFKVAITDKFKTVEYINTVGTGKVVMSWGETGVGIGKIWQSGALDVEGDVNVNGNVSATTLNNYQIVGTSGHRWTNVGLIDASGVMEIGKYLDFHDTNADTSDYTNRLTSSGSGTLQLNGNTITTVADFVSSKAVNGYQKFSSGVIIQWGYNSGTTGSYHSYTFPLAFPTATRAVICMQQGWGATDSMSGITLTKFDYWINGGGTETIGFTWIAIGY